MKNAVYLPPISVPIGYLEIPGVEVAFEEGGVRMDVTFIAWGGGSAQPMGCVGWA